MSVNSELPAATPAEPGDLLVLRGGLRHALFALGLICVALGIVGIVVPGLPTTIFLIIALWAFARSSERFHHWLWEHPRLGPPLRDWHTHRVVPARAKWLAVTLMMVSVVIVAIVAEAPLTALGLAFLLAPIAIYLFTRPGRAPGL